MMPSLVISKTLEYLASAFQGPEAFAGIMGILAIWVGVDYFKK